MLVQVLRLWSRIVSKIEQWKTIIKDGDHFMAAKMTTEHAWDKEPILINIVLFLLHVQ